MEMFDEWEVKDKMDNPTLPYWISIEIYMIVYLILPGIIYKSILVNYYKIFCLLKYFVYENALNDTIKLCWTKYSI